MAGSWQDSGWVEIDETWELPKEARRIAEEILGRKAISRLTRICQEYLWRRKVEASRQRSATDREQLMAIKDAAAALLRALPRLIDAFDKADYSAISRLEGLLLHEYPNHIATRLVIDKDISRSIQDIKETLKEIEPSISLIASAISNSPFGEKKPGRVGGVPLSEADRWLAWRLAELYRHCTGRRPTRDSYNNSQLTSLVDMLARNDVLGCGRMPRLIADALPPPSRDESG